MKPLAGEESTPTAGPGFSRMAFVKVARDSWHATMQTSTGPISAIGDSKGNARHRLDELLVMRRALALESDRRRRSRCASRVEPK
jgi:hypothetical protein